MEYEEKLDAILIELSKVYDTALNTKQLIEYTGINQNELDRLLMYLAKRDYIVYWPTGLSALIHESGRAVLRDGGFKKIKERENDLYKFSMDSASFSKSAVKWAKIAVAVSVIGVLVTLKECSLNNINGVNSGNENGQASSTTN